MLGTMTSHPHLDEDPDFGHDLRVSKTLFADTHLCHLRQDYCQLKNPNSDTICVSAKRSLLTRICVTRGMTTASRRSRFRTRFACPQNAVCGHASVSPAAKSCQQTILISKRKLFRLWNRSNDDFKARTPSALERSNNHFEAKPNSTMESL